MLGNTFYALGGIFLWWRCFNLTCWECISLLVFGGELVFFEGARNSCLPINTIIYSDETYWNYNELCNLNKIILPVQPVENLVGSCRMLLSLQREHGCEIGSVLYFTRFLNGSFTRPQHLLRIWESMFLKGALCSFCWFCCSFIW